MCDKASVAVNGISLTVAGCADEGVRFWLAVIPHTWAVTALRDLKVGDVVNLEIDLLARYTERLLGGGDHQHGGQVISAAWLAEHGWG